MELRHLRYFVAVAEEENVTRAALKLHISQPALSRQVRELEDELGFLLLQRGANSLRLTEGGRVFLAEARAVLLRAEAAVTSARAAANGRQEELHLGYAPSLTARILPPALRAFQAAQPGVRVVWHDQSTEEMLTGLREGQLHLAFLVRPTRGMLRGLRFEELARDPLRLASAPDHPFARKRFVTLAEAVREPIIAYSRKQYPEYHELLTNLFAASKNKPRIVEEHDSVTSLIAAVEAGNGVALAPESLACISGPRLKLVPFSPPVDPLIVGAAWPTRGLGATAERFLRCAKSAPGKKGQP